MEAYQSTREQIGQQNTGCWVGGSKRAIREQVIGGNGDLGVSVAERAIGKKGIGEKMIGERANLGASDWAVIKIKNTVRNI